MNLLFENEKLKGRILIKSKLLSVEKFFGQVTGVTRLPTPQVDPSSFLALV